jgi:septal ring factor EnvC (AmiA/AmiB activator)
MSQFEFRHFRLKSTAIGASHFTELELAFRRRDANGAAPRRQVHNAILEERIQPLAEMLSELQSVHELEDKRNALRQRLTLAETAFEQAALDKRRAPIEVTAADLPQRLTELAAKAAEAESEAQELRAALTAIDDALKGARKQATAALERLPVRAWSAAKMDIDRRTAEVQRRLLEVAGPLLDELEQLDRARGYFMGPAIAGDTVRRFLGPQPAVSRQAEPALAGA